MMPNSMDTHPQPIIGSWEWELESDGLYWSDEVYRLYGLELGEPEATFDLAWKPIHPDDKDRVGKAVEAARKRGIPYSISYCIVLPNGDERAIHSICGVKKDESGKTIRLFGTAQDVTEQKRAEHALQKALLASEELHRVTMEHIQEPLFITDDQGNFTFICRNVLHTLGYTLEELKEMGNLSALLGNEPLFDPAELEVKGDVLNIERGIVDKHGKVRDFLINVTRVSIQGGTRLYVCHEITERKQAEKIVQESRKRLKRAEHIANIGHWEMEIATGKSLWSDEFFRICGFEPGAFEPTAEKGFQVIHPDDREKAAQLVQQAIQEKGGYHIEKRVVRPDGSVRTVLAKGEVICDEHGNPLQLIGTFQDITERKQAEETLRAYSDRLEDMVEERTCKLKDVQEQLLRQEKLAVLGQLAGSVAHELRHPLGVLSNAAYFLKMSLTDADDITYEYLETIETEVRKSDKIISDLLDFSRNQLTKNPFRTLTQLKKLVDEVLMEHPLPEGVELESKFKSDLPPVQIDPQQIKQVLTNLILNAYQAMPDGGTLTVGSRQSAVGSSERSALLTIQDTGCGIAPEHLKTIFEPLFTTKPKGIGLGLAVCKNLIEANGGALTVASKEHEGTTFTVTLPLKEER